MTEAINPLYFIDTNILIYAIDLADPLKQQKARLLLDRCWKREVLYALSTQNLAEFFVVATRKLPGKLSVEQAEQIISDISVFSHWKVCSYYPQTIVNAIKLYNISKKHFWDAVLVATMLENNVTRIYTENENDFKKFKEIQVINPFR